MNRTLQVADDQTAGDRPQHRPNEARNGDKAHARKSLIWRTCAPKVSRPTGTIMAPPQPFKSPAGDQQMDVARFGRKEPTRG